MKKMMKFLSIAMLSILFSFVLAPNNVQAVDTGWGVVPQTSSSNQTSNSTSGEFVYGPYSNEYMDAHPETNFAIRNDTRTYESSSSGTGTGTGNANIFAILKAKIYSTLVDLRRIVYVIAGFGLVMFAVLAIFNKVSYKHLGYIMISLCLLSLMFPFLEYFSGKGTIQVASQTEMDFKNFLDTQYAVVQGTSGDEINAAMNGKGQGGPSCNGEEGCEDEQLALLLPDAGAQAALNPEDMLNSSAMKNMSAFTNAGCPPSGGAGAWRADGTRPVCSTDANGNPVVTQEQCSGKMNKGKCVKTGAQIFGDIVNGFTQTANFVAGAVTAGVGAVSTGAALVSGGKNVVDAMKGLGNAENIHDVLAGLQNVAGAASGAATSVTVGAQTTLAGLGGAANSVGALATIAATNPDSNPTGANSVATGAAQFNQDVNTSNENLGKNLGTTTNALSQGARATRDADIAVTTAEKGLETVQGIMGQMGGH